MSVDNYIEKINDTWIYILVLCEDRGKASTSPEIGVVWQAFSMKVTPKLDFER